MGLHGFFIMDLRQDSTLGHCWPGKYNNVEISQQNVDLMNKKMNKIETYLPN
jgi:hypothetical protein